MMIIMVNELKLPKNNFKNEIKNDIKRDLYNGRHIVAPK